MNDNLIVKTLIEENDLLRRRMWRNFVAGTLMGAIAMTAMFVLTGQ
jgi:ABC-type maltose transport system permease subunit